MYRKILVATDGSESAQRAVALGADLARLHGAQLTLVHVMDPRAELPEWMTYADTQAAGFISPVGTFGGESPDSTRTNAMAEDVERSRELAQQTAERLLRDSGQIALDHGVREMEAVIEEGVPAERIIEAARREHASVIVMGSRGHGPVKELVAGSVSSKVARDAGCSCIAVT